MEPDKLPRWEYKVLVQPAEKARVLERELTELGHECWELVNVVTTGFGDEWRLTAFLRRIWQTKIEKKEFLTSELRALELELDEDF